MNPNSGPGAGGDIHSNQPPPKKSSWLKWVLGCGCGCLLVVGAAVGISIWMGYSVADQYKASVDRGRMYEQRQANAGDRQVFVNSPNKLDGELKRNYVDFSFDYPKTWTFDPRAGNLGSADFAEVDYSEGGYTHEHFVVGDFKLTEKDVFEDEVKMSKNADVAARKFIVKTFGPVQKMGEGYSKFGKYDSYMFRCSANVKTTEGTMLPIWFQIHFVKHPTLPTGVIAFMFASAKDKEVKSMNDLGVKGELPSIIESFEFK